MGEDKADPAQGRISWNSLLGRALIGRRQGGEVAEQRAAGGLLLEVGAFRYE